MSSTVETLEAEALQLSAAERARLVERLIASLDIDPAAQAPSASGSSAKAGRKSGRASEAWLTDYLSGLAAVSNLLAGMAPPCEPC